MLAYCTVVVRAFRGRRLLLVSWWFGRTEEGLLFCVTCGVVVPASRCCGDVCRAFLLMHAQKDDTAIRHSYCCRAVGTYPFGTYPFGRGSKRPNYLARGKISRRQFASRSRGVACNACRSTVDTFFPRHFIVCPLPRCDTVAVAQGQ